MAKRLGLKDQLACTMAKYRMSDCTPGHAGDAEEFRPHGIGIVRLRPRAAIATAALQMIPGVLPDQRRHDNPW